MNNIQHNIVRTSHIARPLFLVCSRQSRSLSLFSLFERTKYWHGTSMGALGEEQLSKRQFFPRGREFAYLWPTTDKMQATEYALRSAERTGTDAILVEVVLGNTKLKMEDLMEYLDFGNHKYPAINLKKADIYIKEIELVVK